MKPSERLADHERFKELAALAHAGALNETERLELERHLLICGACKEAYDGYALLDREGMTFLGVSRAPTNDEIDWNERPVRDKLVARIREADTPTKSFEAKPWHIEPVPFPGNAAVRWAAAAACLLIAVAVGGYRLGSRMASSGGGPAETAVLPVANPEAAKGPSRNLIEAQQTQLSALQNRVASGEQEVTRLRTALHAAEARIASLSVSTGQRDEELKRVSDERDRLAGQLADTEHSFQLVQAELTTLRAEHDRLVLKATSMESTIDDLTSSARDQERRLKDSEQYLASDRDIRELMGARKLYIADVFDVDSGSRTRKPFGRVFYTESKSLIFYAFDLDRQPGVQNASAFQVWGGRDGWSGEKNRATNLGILYMDSESNRRWVLRLQDPKQLAEIDAVFVTVEPHGGSQKPTGKPFLYALLRREANHP